MVYDFRRWTRAAEQWRQYNKDITTLTKWLTEAEQKLADIKLIQDNQQADNAYMVSTVKFLNFQTPENFAVIYLKFKQRGQNLRYFIKMIQWNSKQ